MGCAIVPQDRIYILETCGEFAKEAGPGFHCLPVPCVCSVAGRVNMRIRPLNVAVETKTLDNVFVVVEVVVQYKALKGRIYQAYYTLGDPEKQIRTYVFDALRAAIPKMNIDETFVSKRELAVGLQTSLKPVMSEYGFEIISTLITDIIPDKRVKESMNRINAEKRLRQAAEFKAEAHKIAVVKQAEADCEGKYLQGLGIARQRKCIVDGMNESLEGLKSDTKVDTRNLMDLVLLTQYFETLKSLSSQSKCNTIFITEDEKGNATEEQLRSAVLQGNAAFNRTS